MGRQRGAIRLEGRLGELCFYRLNGKDVVRRIGTVSRAHYEQSESMARVRENAAEFSGASRAGKALREGLQPYANEMGDTYLSGRLNGAMMRVMQQDNGMRGKRMISVVNHGAPLLGFRLNKERSLEAVMNQPYSIQVNGARNEATMAMSTFEPQTMVKAPKGASHFRLMMAMATVSNYSYTNEGYEPLHAAQNGLRAQAESAAFLLNAPATPLLSATLPGVALLGADVALVVALGIRFYAEVNGAMNELNDGKAMDVVWVG
ncbi:MAG: hypothetical protein R2813_07380 [Flavobacteriales bacterium]